MRRAALASVFLASLLAMVCGLCSCTLLERAPGHPSPAADILRGAGSGSVYGAPFGPWGELAGGAIGALVAAAGAYRIGHSRGRARGAVLTAAGGP